MAKKQRKIQVHAGKTVGSKKVGNKKKVDKGLEVVCCRYNNGGATVHERMTRASCAYIGGDVVAPNNCG